LPKITLPSSEQEYKEAGSKFITIPPNADGKENEGDTIVLDLECGMLDWDTPGVSVKFPVKVTQKGSVDLGKSDKISCGVAVNALWKLKETVTAFGHEDAVSFEDGKPVIDGDKLVGAKARGIWTRVISNTDPPFLFAKLQSIIPTGSEAETLV
jgi:hypothetical protein